jgi:hypothetical protein
VNNEDSSPGGSGKKSLLTLIFFQKDRDHDSLIFGQKILSFFKTEKGGVFPVGNRDSPAEVLIIDLNPQSLIHFNE